MKHILQVPNQDGILLIKSKNQDRGERTVIKHSAQSYKRVFSTECQEIL